MVVATKPGTSVPLTVYRDNQRKSLNITIDELDLEAEQGRTAHRSETKRRAGADVHRLRHDARAHHARSRPSHGSAAQPGRRLVSDVDRDSAAGNAGIVPGDVILEVNRQKVATVTQVTRELQNVAAGTPVFLLIWRDGQQVFVTMTKH